MHIFDCKECGARVVSYLYQLDDEREKHPQLCATCTWINGIKDPVEREQVRAYINRHREEQG
jgi:hypothetical protein